MTTYAELLSRPLPVRVQPTFARAVPAMIMALATLLPHFILGAAFGAYGFVWIVAVTLASFVLSWEIGFALLMACLFLQNAFIAACMPLISDRGDFSLLLGTSFGLTTLFALIYGPAWLKLRRELPAESGALLRWIAIFSAVIIAYTALGAATASATSTLVYARIYFTGALMLIIGVAFGFQLTFSFALGVTRILTVILAMWAGLEYFFTHGLYEFFHIVEFFNYKLSSLSYATAFASIDEVIDIDTNSYLNLSGQFGLGLELLRPLGPNFHSISYAYATAFCSLTCFMIRRPLLALISFAILLLIGAKGPLLMTLLALGLGLLYLKTRNRRWVLIGLSVILGLFVGGGIIYGIASEDYHVVGLLGGLNGFVHNPLGRGIGVGGSLSTLGMTRANFSLFQGYGADFALESGLGVMLYQIGIGAIAFFIFYWKLWKSVWDATGFFASEPRLIVIPVVLAFLFANSVFQEEVFSPTGWGLWLLLSGLLLARRWRADTNHHAPV